MPKINEPVTEGALPETEGSSTITPLLSVEKSATGLTTWLDTPTKAGPQAPLEHV
jgi:hypothetical protein